MKISLKTVSLKKVLITIGLIVLDLSLYIFFGLILMGYENMYTTNKDEMWSLSSMTSFEKFGSIGMSIINLLNILVIGFIIYKITHFFLKKEIVT